jgi:UDP-2-acetamido-2-deoxy-ribo-hexuluronate aminotransferase
LQFVDLKHQYQLYKDEIHAEMEKVLSSAAFINGQAVKDLEAELARRLGTGVHAVGCASGTDALLIALMALDVTAGDEIIIPDFTFIATAETVSLLGARPVFVDIDPETYNIDPQAVEAAITERTSGIVAVSLYGQCAEMDALNDIAERHGLWVMEDAAQSFGATYHGRPSGALSRVATTSFFPAKPLGCYGDGGAVFTRDAELAERMKRIRNHGQARRYYHTEVGVNGRLDTLQAAVLLAKLRHFNDETAARQRVAEAYSKALSDVVKTPIIREYNTSVWAQYTIAHEKRDDIRAHLKDKGIPTAVHYPKPLHWQKTYGSLGVPGAGLRRSMHASQTVVSLPMHPFLSDEDIDQVATAVKEAVNG